MTDQPRTWPRDTANRSKTWPSWTLSLFAAFQADHPLPGDAGLPSSFRLNQTQRRKLLPYGNSELAYGPEHVGPSPVEEHPLEPMWMSVHHEVGGCSSTQPKVSSSAGVRSGSSRRP